MDSLLEILYKYLSVLQRDARKYSFPCVVFELHLMEPFDTSRLFERSPKQHLRGIYFGNLSENEIPPSTRYFRLWPNGEAYFVGEENLHALISAIDPFPKLIYIDEKFMEMV